MQCLQTMCAQYGRPFVSKLVMTTLCKKSAERPAHRKSIRGHTNLISAHVRARTFNVTFDPSARIPKNLCNFRNATAVLIPLIIESHRK